MPQINSQKSFASEFLDHYLKNGMASMSKSDVDSLVMHLLDKYAYEKGAALKGQSNQELSETLRAPLSKIRRMRYEAGLKYGGADEPKKRFLACLHNASLEINEKTGDPAKITLIIEDILAKNWIQGHLKGGGSVYDGSFNAEILKVDSDGFFSVLKTLLKDEDVDLFERKYRALAEKKKGEALANGFAELLKSFVKGAVSKAGGELLSKATMVVLPYFGG